MRFRRVLFDLDGTLTDPSEGITRCISHAMQNLDLSCPNLNELERYIGPPLIDTFAELGVEEDRLQRAVELFRERFTDVGITENLLYPGIESMLTSLADANVEIYLATSKPEPFAERVLEEFGLTRFFDVIAGATMDGSRLHKSDVIAHALRNSSGSDAVMVGDRMHDLAGAATHSLPGIGVTWGFGSLDELRAENPLAIVDTPEELQAEIFR